jgi:hypothetical protein
MNRTCYVKIRCRDGVVQPFMINPKNLRRLQNKYKERIEVCEATT